MTTLHFLLILATTLLLFPSASWAAGCLTADCHAGLLQAPHLHPPAAAGDCLRCHRPASPDHPAEMTDDLLLRPGAGKELCLDCHQEVGRQMSASVRHPPLFRERGCTLCHSAHSSPSAALLQAPQQSLCLGCHGRDDFTRSDPLRNIARELAGKAVLHGPVAAGDCAGCHRPHGSPHYRLLTGRYPAGVYAPYRAETYGFCFQCHDADLLDEQSEATGFRQPGINLHFLHVADPRKGRSCRSCHAPHGADNPLLIRSEGTPFGAWQIPVNFRKTPTGGSCAPGCHRATPYDRNAVPERGQGEDR